MPMIDADGCLLNVSVEGRDGGPTLMLSNSLGCTLQMWEPQMKALTQLFRVIRYDRRGHGKSRRAARPLFDGAFRPRRAGDPRRSQHRQGALVRPVDGRHGRAMAGRPTRRSVSTGSCSPIPPAIIADPTNWLQPHQGGQGRRHRRRRRYRDRGLADRGFPRARAADHREHEGDAAGNAGRGLSRLLRSAEHARPARAAAKDQEPDAGDRGPSRHGDAACGRRIDPQQHSRAPA